MPTSDHSHHILDTNIPIFRPKPGIFSDLNLCEIAYSLEGKCEIPTKYLYFGEGVENWNMRSINKKEDLGNYTHGTVNKEYQLMNSTLDLVLGAVSDTCMVNVVDIGPGTGYPTFPVLSFLQEKKKLGKYIAIDIVDKMNDLAITNLTGIDILSKMKTQKYVHDFEYGHFADLMMKERKDGTVNLFTFIGSTLGNMVDRHRALANIRDSMTEGDLLWVGITLHNVARSLVSYYSNLEEINSPEYKKICKYHTSLLESFGMQDWMDYGSIVLEEVEDTGFIQYFFKIKKSFILEFPKINNSKSDSAVRLKYQTGDKIIVNRSKSYQDQDLVAEFREAGLKIKMMNVSNNYQRALVLASI